MNRPDCKGCHEYSELSRRNFVGLATGVAASAVVPSWLPRVALADSYVGERDVLVSVFLRGGVDALTICVPFLEDNYYKSRPTLSIAPPDSGGKNKVTPLDDSFGFPPAMQALHEKFDGGDLLIVHACGMKHGNRSHFDAMKFMEVGRENPQLNQFTGWLGRHLLEAAPTSANGVLRAVSIGGAGLPVMLLGAPKAVPIQELADLRHLCSRPDRLLPADVRGCRRSASNRRQEHHGDGRAPRCDRLRELSPAAAARYPSGQFGDSLKSTAALIKAEVGVEAVAIDLGDWDMHEKQGPFDGWMAWKMTELAEGLAAFHEDLSAGKGQPVTTVVMSEFGRNTSENGRAGTDHGAGGLMMALGDGIKGGRVLTEWPGLERENLFEGQDLQVTIDYRDIITEIVAKRLGNRDHKSLFPDPRYKPTEYGVAK